MRCEILKDSMLYDVVLSSVRVWIVDLRHTRKLIRNLK